MKRKTTHPLIPSLSFYLGSGIFLFWLFHLTRHILRMTGGRLIYGLDDPYIHLAIARTLVEHGNYGVTQYAVDFANSSVIWPLLLVLFGAITKEWIWLPYIFNIVFGLGCLWVIDAIGKKLEISLSGRFMVIFLFLVLTPVMPLVLNGMEHVLHIFTLLLIIYFYLTLDASSSWRDPGLWRLIAMVFVTVLVRFESVFYVIGLSAVLMTERKWKASALILLAGILPVVLNGIVMMGMGGYFISYSLMVKGQPFDWGALLDIESFIFHRILKSLIYGFRWRFLFMLLLVLVLTFVPAKEKYAFRLRQLLSVSLLAILFNVMTIGTGPLFRYEGYVIGVTVVICGFALLRYLRSRSLPGGRMSIVESIIPAGMLVLVFLFPLVREGYQGSTLAITASLNIYEQQYQVSRFLSRYYRNTPVALNDIGLTVFDGHVKPVDLVGLAEKRVAKSRRDRTFTTDSIRATVRRHGSNIAVLYDSWFEDEMSVPQEWQKVEKWIIRDNIVCGDSIVSFYALNERSASLLRQQLNEFRSKLPGRVKAYPVDFPDTVSALKHETVR